MRRAIEHPFNSSESLTKISARFHFNLISTTMKTPNKCSICILWNILDTLIYAILPFFIIFLCSLMIIGKIFVRRRAMAKLGGLCHLNRRMVSAQDNLSILLITINCLFLIMIGPFNIYLIIQSIRRYWSTNEMPTKFVQQIQEYLRLIQNSYHAFGFVFYCLIGEKFRLTARSSCLNVYRRWKKYSNRTTTGYRSCTNPIRSSSTMGATVSKTNSNALPLNNIVKSTDNEKVV